MTTARDDSDKSYNDRYINEEGKGPSFHTDAFMRGYNAGVNCSDSDNNDNDNNDNNSNNNNRNNDDEDQNQNQNHNQERSFVGTEPTVMRKERGKDTTTGTTEADITRNVHQTIAGHGAEALRLDMKSAGAQGDTKNVTTNTSANTGRNLCILGRSWDL